MKIIGSTPEGLLISAHKDEVTNLIGYYSTYSDKCPKVEVGMDIRVHDMYMALREIQGLEAKMEQARGVLRALIGGLTIVDPIARAVQDTLSGTKVE